MADSEAMRTGARRSSLEASVTRQRARACRRIACATRTSCGSKSSRSPSASSAQAGSGGRTPAASPSQASAQKPGQAPATRAPIDLLAVRRIVALGDSVTAGDVAHSMPCTPSPADTNSASTAGGEALAGK